MKEVIKGKIKFVECDAIFDLYATREITDYDTEGECGIYSYVIDIQGLMAMSFDLRENEWIADFDEIVFNTIEEKIGDIDYYGA